MFDTLIKDVRDAWRKQFGNYTPQEQQALAVHAAKLEAVVNGQAAFAASPKVVMDFVLAGKSPEEAVAAGKAAAKKQQDQSKGYQVLIGAAFVVILLVGRR